MKQLIVETPVTEYKAYTQGGLLEVYKIRHRHKFRIRGVDFSTSRWYFGKAMEKGL